MPPKKKTTPAEPLTLESLAKDVAGQNKKIEKLEAALGESQKLNKALGEELKKKPTAAAVESVVVKKEVKANRPTKPVTYKGEQYVFTTPKARGLKGEVINTEAVVESPEMFEAEIAHWASKAPGILKKKV